MLHLIKLLLWSLTLLFVNTEVHAQSPTKFHAYAGAGIVAGDAGSNFTGYTQQVGLKIELPVTSRFSVTGSIGLHKMNGLDESILYRYREVLLDRYIDVSIFTQLNWIAWLESDLSVQLAFGSKRKWGVNAGGRIALRIAERLRSYQAVNSIGLNVFVEESQTILPAIFTSSLASLENITPRSGNEVLNKLNYAPHLGLFYQLTKGFQLELTSRAYLNNIFVDGAFYDVERRPLTVELKTIVRL